MKNDELLEIEAAEQKWKKKNAKQLETERQKKFLMDTGIELKTVYTPLDLDQKGFHYLKDLGFPGEYPYTRGISPTMYRGELWGISQYSGYSTPQACNELWKTQIANGSNSIYIAYDLPSQVGLDPDDSRAEGEVGRTGCSMTSQRDWEIAFDGIDISKLAVTQVINAPAVIGIANHICLVKKRGINLRNVQGFCQTDILKEYVARGNYIFPPTPSMRLVTDILAYCNKNMPNYQAAQFCSLHQAEMGANAIHEIAFGLANVFTYLQNAVNRGLDIDDVAAAGINMLVTCDSQGFFEEIAKLRAMRRIYAKIMKEQFRAKKPESLKLRIYGGHSGSSVHREQYLNNIARNAIAGVAAALSGCQQIDLRPYDEQYGIPTKEAIVNSIRVQHVIGLETGITDTVDPLGGSYFVEWLTSEMEGRIMKELEKIEELGGVINCIENGYLKRKIAEDAYKWQKAFEAGEVLRVGANCFTSDIEEKPSRIYRSDPAVEQERIKAVTELRKSRNNQKVKQALKEVKTVASSEPTPENNIMPAMIEAVSCYATVGEICGVLREVWGEYTDTNIF